MQDIQAGSLDNVNHISDQEIAIFNQVWKSKDMAPRIKTFAWRIIMRALATRLRGARYSSHIKKEWCRCCNIHVQEFGRLTS